MKKILSIFMTLMMSFTMFANQNISDTLFENANVKIIKVNAPAKIRIYNDDSFRFLIRSNNEYINNRIKYSIVDSTLNVWIDKLTSEEIAQLTPENLIIAISAPHDIDIKTTKSLLITSKHDKKKKLTNYENN